MRTILMGIIIAVVMVTSGSSSSWSQSCITEMKQAKLQMRMLAEQCGAEAALIASIDSGYVPPEARLCSQPLSVAAQNEAFNECARVYTCAVITYQCAIEKAQAGMDCTYAAQTCLQEHPIPQY